MTRPRLNLGAERALRTVLAAGFLLMLTANLPGHMSQDSVLELYEGRFHVRESWGPAFYAWVLGAFDAAMPGSALYVTASGLVLFVSLASFASLRGRVSWLGAGLALLMVLTPQVLVYQGIVWKDVLFANLAIAGMVCLAHAAVVWDRRVRRAALLAAALLLLAAATLTRQNGFIVAVLAAAALGWTAAARRGWKGGLGWGFGGLAAVALAAQLIGAYAAPTRAGPDDGFGKGVRILRHYDLVGALALDSAQRLEIIEKVSPNAALVLRRDGAKAYSAERMDTLDELPSVAEALWSIPDDAVEAQWWALILHRPGLYLRERREVFRWVFLTPVLDRCLPVSLGVDGPPDRMAPLGLVRRWTPMDQQLVDYTARFEDTPLYSHLTYALIALAVSGLLLIRRNPADLPMAALTLSGVGFAASFFVISIACDYRYLYFLDLSAMAGLLYLAVDPLGGWTGRGRSGRA